MIYDFTKDRLYIIYDFTYVKCIMGFSNMSVQGMMGLAHMHVKDTRLSDVTIKGFSHEIIPM